MRIAGRCAENSNCPHSLVPIPSSPFPPCPHSLQGRDRDIELRTVGVHIRRLRQTLNLGGRPELIRTVRSAGYALDDDHA